MLYCHLASSYYFLACQDVQAAADEEKTIVLYGSADGKNVNCPNDVAEVATRVLLFSAPHMGMRS
jgi:hypothetical protein